MIYRTNFKRKCSIEDINFSRMFLFAATEGEQKVTDNTGVKGTQIVSETPGEAPAPTNSIFNTEGKQISLDELPGAPMPTVTDGKNPTVTPTETESTTPKPTAATTPTPAVTATPGTQTVATTPKPTGATTNGENPTVTTTAATTPTQAVTTTTGQNPPGTPTGAAVKHFDAIRNHLKELSDESKLRHVSRSDAAEGVNKLFEKEIVDKNLKVIKDNYNNLSKEKQEEVDRILSGLEKRENTAMNRVASQVDTIKDEGLKTWWNGLDEAQRAGYVAAAGAAGMSLGAFLMSKRKMSDAAIWGGVGTGAMLAAGYAGNAWNAKPGTYNLLPSVKQNKGAS